MSFKEAYQKMLEGHKVKRPCFNGWWFIDGVTNKLTIHLANADEITEGDLDHTVRNTLANDWQVVKIEE